MEAYGELVVRTGVNLREGQCLLVNTGAGTYQYARAIAKAAYKAGAKFVSIRIQDPELNRYRIEEGKKEYLDYLPNFVQAESFEFLAMDWARIRIEGNEDKDALEGVNSADVETIQRALRTTLKRQQEKMMRDEHSWLVTSAPGPRWAEWIAKTAGLPLEGAYERLEEAFIKIMRLDKADPIAAWQEHIATIGRRSQVLNDLNLDTLRFTGPGTDLSIGLCKGSVWRGGSDGETPDGRPFVANMPTEEVYTTPDFSRTTGKVQVCRPVTVMETLVRDAWFEFRNGKVVDFGASSGKEILERYLASDEGASFLGEVALVDVDSPIYQSGYVFGSILFDENASCHIALGAGYPSCLKEARSLTGPVETKAAGCNVSVVHTDFMIGTPQTDVTGTSRDGKEIPIIRAGRFVI